MPVRTPPLFLHGTAGRELVDQSAAQLRGRGPSPTVGLRLASRDDPSKTMTMIVRIPHIFAVGSAHIERRGRMAIDYVAGASVPGTMREDVGGGTFNALRMAVRRGARGTLMSVRGGDGAGMRVAETMIAEGITDASAIFLDRPTPSHTALLDRHGRVVAALADLNLYDIAFPKQMRRAKIRAEIAGAEALLADADLPEAALDRLIAAAAGTPVFALATSPAKSVRLRSALPQLSCLFMNRKEAAALAAGDEDAEDAVRLQSGDPLILVERLNERGLACGVITDGSKPIIAFDHEKRWQIRPPKPRRIVDVSGAGDALAGATIAALLRGVTYIEAAREGAAAALLAIETETNVPNFSDEAFSQALELVPAAVDMA